MKTRIKLASIFMMLFLGISMSPKNTSAQGVSVSFQVFYDELSPYGTWVDYPDYGYVWVPDVAPGFSPYATNGYWVLTDDGWTWVSNYSWGWAPFHYGRWFNDANYGPMWVPDNEWGPGWVSWRRSEGYYGWAPIGPGISIDVAYSNGYNIPYNQWTFVRGRDFGRTNINNYYVNSSNNVTIINNTTVINNTRIDRSSNVRYNAGPERTEVEKRGGRKISQVAIRDNNKPGQSLRNNQLQIYRPRVQKEISNGTRPSPAKVENLKNVKTSEQRNTNSTRQKVNHPNKQQPTQQKRNVAPTKQKPSQQQRNIQPTRQQQSQPQRNEQPAKQQQSQPQRNVQPAKQQQSQPQRNAQPEIQKQPQRNVQPAQQQPQPLRSEQPSQQKKSQPKRTNSPKKAGNEKQPR